jgi:hypothetical protein
MSETLYDMVLDVVQMVATGQTLQETLPATGLQRRANSALLS